MAIHNKALPMQNPPKSSNINIQTIPEIYHFPNPACQRPYHGMNVNIYRFSLSPLFDLDAIGKLRELASKAGSEGPVVQIAEVRFKRWVDEPLIVFFGERTNGRDAARCSGTWGCGSLW